MFDPESIFVITYDLNKKGQNYKGTDAMLENVFKATRVLDSVWVIRTTSNISAQQIHDTLTGLDGPMDENDGLVVADAKSATGTGTYIKMTEIPLISLPKR
jgi:hypothetical protein